MKRRVMIGVLHFPVKLSATKGWKERPKDHIKERDIWSALSGGAGCRYLSPHGVALQSTGGLNSHLRERERERERERGRHVRPSNPSS